MDTAWGGGGFLPGHKTGGPWSDVERKDHINVLELKAAKLVILTLCHLLPKFQSTHLQMNNLIAFSYLLKMGGRGGYTQPNTLKSRQGDLGYLLDQGIMITCGIPPK